MSNTGKAAQAQTAMDVVTAKVKDLETALTAQIAACQAAGAVRMMGALTDLQTAMMESASIVTAMTAAVDEEGGIQGL